MYETETLEPNLLAYLEGSASYGFLVLFIKIIENRIILFLGSTSYQIVVIIFFFGIESINLTPEKGRNFDRRFRSKMSTERRPMTNEENAMYVFTLSFVNSLTWIFSFWAPDSRLDRLVSFSY